MLHILPQEARWRVPQELIGRAVRELSQVSGYDEGCGSSGESAVRDRQSAF